MGSHRRFLGKMSALGLLAVMLCLSRSSDALAAAAQSPGRAAIAWEMKVYAKLSNIEFHYAGLRTPLDGMAFVNFSIDRRGNIVGPRIARSSGS
jgi:outer membrane biosynthesis protein TonB